MDAPRDRVDVLQEVVSVRCHELLVLAELQQRGRNVPADENQRIMIDAVGLAQQALLARRSLEVGLDRLGRVGVEDVLHRLTSIDLPVRTEPNRCGLGSVRVENRHVAAIVQQGTSGSLEVIADLGKA